RRSSNRLSSASPGSASRSSRRSLSSAPGDVQPALMRLRNWFLVWCGWTALALFFAVSTSLTYLSTGRPANWWPSISRALLEWWLWALLTPVVVQLARRYPAERRWRHVAIHAVAGFVLAFVKMSADRALFAWLTGAWIYWLASTLALQIFVYLPLPPGGARGGVHHGTP